MQTVMTYFCNKCIWKNKTVRLRDEHVFFFLWGRITGCVDLLKYFLLKDPDLKRQRDSNSLWLRCIQSFISLHVYDTRGQWYHLTVSKRSNCAPKATPSSMSPKTNRQSSFHLFYVLWRRLNKSVQRAKLSAKAWSADCLIEAYTWAVW